MEFKSDHPSLPLISVITVVKNGAETLRATLESVYAQTYSNIELLVIDGGSDDGTLNILKEHDDRIDLWISEPDGGIYDAMNKALDMASGKYVHFLNADDHYTFSRVLELVMEAFQKHRPRFVHTNVLMLNDRKGFGWVRHSNVSRYYYLFKGMPQQAFFYEKSIFDDLGKFDTSYPVVADLEFLLRMTMKHGVRGRYLNTPAVVFLSGGVSGDMKRKKQQREEVLRKYFPGWALIFLRNKLFERLLTRNELRGKKKSMLEKVLK